MINVSYLIYKKMQILNYIQMQKINSNIDLTIAHNLYISSR